MSAMVKTLTVALAGNPNSGKTTTFNNLTGTRQKVGNWPGVTVEKKEGRISFEGHDLTLVDLPGTYSLTAFSIEEIVARDFILNAKPDVVVDIIDASNLERSLYLATQIRELDTRVILVLNMADVMLARGFQIDADKLSSLLDVPVLFTVGNKNQGSDLLLRKVIEVAQSGKPAPPERRVHYSKDIEAAIADVAASLRQAAGPGFPYDARWVSIKLLEDDPVVRDNVAGSLAGGGQEVLRKAESLRRRLTGLFDDDPAIIMTEERYGFIAGIVKEILKAPAQARVDVSRNIDMVLTHRFFGFPIFLFFIWAMFHLTFSVGSHPAEWIGQGFALLSDVVRQTMPPSLARDLVVDGALAGLGSVMVFLPNILILFFCIAIFEDTGYMARAAFLMDKLMHLVGLHGKSFIPLLMGFGCNVPAIMATRTLESEKDRLLTMLLVPFMSCSARLPVYVLLAGAFFPRRAATVIFGIYVLGIVLAVVMGRLLRSTLLSGQTAPFVMELPPYRMPMARSLLIHTWDRAKMFLKKMAGIILLGSVAVWALSTFPAGQDQDRSYLARMGKAIEPAMAPLGLDWKNSVALLSGMVAKEIIISTLGVLHGSDAGAKDTTTLAARMRASGMTSFSALAMMAFVLLYVPCMATVAAIRQESNSWKWAAFSMGYSILLAWITSFVIYQGGRLLGLG